MQSRSRGSRNALFATLALLIVAGTGSTLFFVPRIVQAHWDDMSSEGKPKKTQTFDWHGSLDAGHSVVLHGVNGGVVADRAPGSDVVVHAVKSARRHDPAEVEIKIDRRPNGDIVLYALYPGGGNSYADGEYHSKTRNNDVKVEWEVHVPRGAGLEAHVVNGGIKAVDLDGNVVAETVNGGIAVAATGTAQASTVNGSIRASVGSSAWTGKLDFTTVNGSIGITLPEDVGAEVRAETVNGRINTDFPVSVQGTFGRRELKGVIGKGGGTLKLETVNGGIMLNRRT